MKAFRFFAVIVVAWIVASVVGGVEAVYMHSNNIKIECIMMPQLLVGMMLLLTSGILYDEGKRKISKCLLIVGGVLVYASINIINVIYTL